MRRISSFGLALAVALPACSAPISTRSSPAHPRVVEIFNTTDEYRLLEILPAANQALTAPTTFKGTLRPGETKVLYLYNGFTYRVRMRDTHRGGAALVSDIRVDENMRLSYAGDSLARVGEPTVEVGPARAVRSEDARDRVRLLHGEPDRLVQRRLESAVDARYVGQPFEVWTYFATGYKYVFLDEHRSGRYVLLTSSDPQEQGRPGWEERLPAEVVQDILRE
ncbi:MAG: hypothetical protein ABR599_11510 [Gemmatimonadota bacterium]